MARASELLRRVATSRTSCEVQISGPRGIGKSWLLSQVEKEGLLCGFEVLRVGAPRQRGTVHPDTRRPLLIVADDMHDLDPQLLVPFRHGPTARPALMVSTWNSALNSRPGGRPPQHGSPSIIDMPLGPLPEQVVRHVAEGILGAIPGDTLMPLLASTDGNPGALLELARGLCHDDLIHKYGDVAELRTSELPRRFVHMVSGVAGALSERAREVLVCAALLDQECGVEDVACLLGQSVSSLAGAFIEACEARFLCADNETVVFRHEPVRRALLRGVPLSVGKAVHRQAADMLLARGGSILSAAHHAARGARRGDPQTMTLLLRAVQEVMRDSPQEALALSTRGLELVLPHEKWYPLLVSATMEAHIRSGFPGQAIELALTALSTGPDPQAEATIQYWLSVALSESGRPHDGLEIARSLLDQPSIPPDLRRELMLSERMIRVMHLDPATAPATSANTVSSQPALTRTTGADLALAAVEHWRQGRVTHALHWCREAVQCDVWGSWLPLDPQAMLLLFLTALRQTAEARAILGEPHPGSAASAEAVVRLVGARLKHAEGNHGGAEAEARAVLATTRGVVENSPQTRQALICLTTIYLERGDSALMTEYLERLRSLRTDGSSWRWSAADSWLWARVAAAQGDRKALLRALDEVDHDKCALLVLLVEEPAAAAWLARAFLGAGAPERARSVWDTIDRVARENPGVGAVAAAASHARGVCRQDLEALGLAVKMHQDPWARASATEDIGTLLTATDQAQAVQHLNEAGAAYQAIGASQDAARVRRRLRHLGVVRRHWNHPARTTDKETSLTDTERKVADLVAEGMTNQQVARAMYISPHTVAFHLRQTYRKLGIHSRVELARRLYRSAG